MFEFESDQIERRLDDQKQQMNALSRGMTDLLKATGKRKGATAQSRPADTLLVRAAVSELLRPLRTTATGVVYEKTVSEVAHERYPGERDLHDYLARAATPPANTTTVGNGAELMATATVALLGGDAATGFAQLASQTLNVGVQGLVKVAYRVSPVALAGGWVGEGAPKPVYTIPIADILMTPSKLVALSVWTDEIASYALTDIEALVRDTLRHDLGALLDTAAFDANPASAGIRPAGLFSGATAVTASNATPLTEAMLVDLGALGAAVSVNTPDARPLFVMNPKQARRLALTAPGFGGVIVTGYMPAGTVGAIDASSVVTMLGDVSFMASSNATIHMDNSAPAAIGTAGVPNVVAAPTLSLFQANLVGLRSVLRVSWTKRRTGATALTTSVTW